MYISFSNFRDEYFCVSAYILISDCGRFKIKINSTAAKPQVNKDGTCTLTFISDRFLITAAHCLTKL